MRKALIIVFWATLALAVAIWADNTITGTGAGTALTSKGVDNALYGNGTAQVMTIGKGNTIIGEQAGRRGYGTTGTVKLGYLSGQADTSSHKLFITTGFYPTKGIFGDFSTGYFGVNTTSPTTAWTISGTATQDTTVSARFHASINGGAGNPVFSRSTDKDTGIYFYTNTGNRIGVSAKGSNVATFDSAGVTATNFITSGNVTASNSLFNVDSQNNTSRADGFHYFDFVVDDSTDAASSAETGAGFFRHNKRAGSNGTYIINGIEGVAASYYADEAGTFRGVYGRTYTAPGATPTMRTAVGGEFSARASYSGGDSCVAESGTAFVGSRVWMAPYFTTASMDNINNFWGLWIYGEHANYRNGDAAIKISTAGGGFTNDINLQNGETISNATNGTIAMTGSVTVSGTLTAQAQNMPTQALLADSTLTAYRSGYTYIARPLAAKATATLPTAAAGLNYTFFVADADSLRIAVAGTDSLIDNTGAAYVVTTSVAGSVKVVGTAGKWFMLPYVGTWTSY